MRRLGVVLVILLPLLGGCVSGVVTPRPMFEPPEASIRYGVLRLNTINDKHVREYVDRTYPALISGSSGDPDLHISSTVRAKKTPNAGTMAVCWLTFGFVPRFYSTTVEYTIRVVDRANRTCFEHTSHGQAEYNGYGIAGLMSELVSPNETYRTTLLTRASEIAVRRCIDNLIESEGIFADMLQASPARATVANAKLPPSASLSARRALGQSWAVIIGLSDYGASGDGRLNRLPFATDDATAIAESLTRHGWSSDHMRVLLNSSATERNIKVALESWLTKAGANDMILLYWAGHGYPDPEDPEKVYFACYDTDINIPATGYRMDQVTRALKESKAKNVIVIADTCHAGKLITRGGERGLSVVPRITQMSKKQEIPKGWVYMVSADADRKAIEHSSWKNGAFTHCLLEGLKGKADGFQSAGPKDGKITLGELRSYLTTSMPEETQRVLGVAKHPLITTSSGSPGIWELPLNVGK